MDAQLAIIDRDYLLAWNQAVYTKGSSTQWEQYVTSELAGDLQANLSSDITSDSSGNSGIERIYDVTVSAMPYFPGSQMVDYCMSWNGKLSEEEQDALSQVDGAWKINTVDTFTSTAGHTLPGEPTQCYSSATPGS
jgi:hypothetical protein